MNDLDVVGTKEISVTFVNGVEDADIWILPQTDENLGTTLWGTPTLKDSVKDTIGTCRIEGGAENYIVRIIDADEAYYAARDFMEMNTAQEHHTVPYPGAHVPDGAQSGAEKPVRFCQNCGAQAGDGKFCEYCGSPLKLG